MGLGGGLCKWGPCWCWQIWPILPLSPVLILLLATSLKDTQYSLTCRTSSVAFNMRNTTFFLFLSPLMDCFFFNFWRAERHKAVTSSVTGCLHPPAKLPVPFPAGTVSRGSRHGPAHHPTTTHVLQGSCQCLWATSDSETRIFQKV